MHKILSLLVLAAALAPLNALGQVSRGKITVAGSSLELGDFTLIAQTKNGIKSASVGADGKFTVSGASSVDRFSLLYRSNYYSPVVLAVRRGKALKNFKAALRSSFCESSSARAILSTKRRAPGALNLEVDTTRQVAYLKKVSKEQTRSYLRGASAATGTDCLPSGISATPTGDTRAQGMAPLDPSDSDGDGTANDLDLDDDDDGVSDAFDADNDGDGVIDDSDPDNNDRGATAQLFYFQQLHLDRKDSYHPRLAEVTSAMIDAALVSHGGLALEVKDGASVELNCGGGDGGTGLHWCSAGGSGRTREPYPDGLELPEGLDADADGKAEISAGGTGDLQVAPGATSSQILPGDTFIEEVTDAEGVVTEYVGVLNSVVHTVPGIVNVVTAEGTYTFDYPANSASVGTFANPILVPSTGDTLATISLYPPVYFTSEGSIVPGRLTIALQIPSGPCSYDSVTEQCHSGESGPGLMPGALYSSPSTGWELASDGVRSAAGSVDTSVDESTSMSFTVNLTGTGGVTGWDAGEYLMVPIQAFDQNGTTSAHNVIFRRKP